jgi:hypothetical protein
MMDEFIHWPNLYLLLSPTCDEILLWVIEIWMKNHMVSDNNSNTVNLQGTTNNVGLTSMSDTIPWVTISIEQDN